MIRTLVKVPLFVLVETDKVDQQKVKEILYKCIQETLKSEDFIESLVDIVNENLKPTIVRIFSDSDLINKALKDV